MQYVTVAGRRQPAQQLMDTLHGQIGRGDPRPGFGNGVLAAFPRPYGIDLARTCGSWEV